MRHQNLPIFLSDMMSLALNFLLVKEVYIFYRYNIAIFPYSYIELSFKKKFKTISVNSISIK